MMANGAESMNLRRELHDLSQPLTRLQWRLELGQHAGSDAELRETIAAALVEVSELMDWVRQVRAKTDGQQDFAGRVA
jgi:hypothetical protein